MRCPSSPLTPALSPQGGEGARWRHTLPSPPPQGGRGQAEPVLSVRNLSTEVATPEGSRIVVDNLSFDIAAGETLCIAGESGSGKSMTALSVMRLLPEPMARIAGGTVLLAGRELTTIPEAAMRRVRGGDIAMIFQEPMTSLNPVLTIGRQLAEAILAHREIGAREARKAAVDALAAVRISEPERRLRQYPHELSGGMRQRVMIAMALAGRPQVLIADEPTTALDVTVQAQILDLIRALQREFGTAVILITHDMGVVAEMADRVVVMHEGKVVEAGPVERIFAAPEAEYTRALLAAVPRLGAMAGRGEPLRADATRTAPTQPAGPAQPAAPVLDVSNLTVGFDIKGGILQRTIARVHAVEGVSFAIRPGETLALVGESGCGKSTTGKALLGLVRWEGHVSVAGQDAQGLGRNQMKALRRNIQMVFQDPYASLDPRMNVGDLVAEPLLVHRVASGSEVRDRVAALFRRVGLTPEQMRRHPHEFSGGQRQRVAIARALALSPKIIVADESVSALDVSVQARVLDLLQELQDELGVAYLFISHDMAVVEQVSHCVAVMYLGQIVETGTRRQIFEDPRHAYTRRLIEAVPVADPMRRRDRQGAFAGEMGSAMRPLGASVPRLMLRDVGEGHLVAAD
ncbi:MAG: ABC transporter ATP-binding protein [Rhizobiales bacterium]|nr:ABC transporter ATP-binding protein [Hyphomicrobiales bacterium]